MYWNESESVAIASSQCDVILTSSESSGHGDKARLSCMGKVRKLSGSCMGKVRNLSGSSDGASSVGSSFEGSSSEASDDDQVLASTLPDFFPHSLVLRRSMNKQRVRPIIVDCFDKLAVELVSRNTSFIMLLPRFVSRREGRCCVVTSIVTVVLSAGAGRANQHHGLSWSTTIHFLGNLVSTTITIRMYHKSSHVLHRSSVHRSIAFVPCDRAPRYPTTIPVCLCGSWKGGNIYTRCSSGEFIYIYSYEYCI